MSKNKSKKKAKNKKRRNVQKAPRPLLSLCLIARDEAAFLQNCLASVEALVDEIVVVDTGSQDDTQAVARRFGARVFDEIWHDDFSRARNRALDEARGQWVLVLDCDEVLAPGDHARLRALLRSDGPGAYRLTTRNYSAAATDAGWVACDGTYAEEKAYDGFFPSTKVRLWRQRKDVRFAGVVHELVEPSLLNAGIAVGDCLVPVHHYGYVEKPRADYLQVGERKVRENPGDLRARYELAIAYRNADRLDDALLSIDAVVAGLGAVDAEARIYVQEQLVLLVRADVLAKLDRAVDALAAYDELLARFSDSHQALNNKGLLLEQAGRLDDARTCYERGVELAPDNKVLAGNLRRLTQTSSDLTGDWQTCLRSGHALYTAGKRTQALYYFRRIVEAGESVQPVSVLPLALTLMGRCLLEDRRYEEALVPLARAVEMGAGDALALLSLGDVLVKVGRYRQAVECLQAAAKGKRDPHFSLDKTTTDYSIHFFLGQALSGLGRQSEAEAAFSEAARLAPERSEAGQALALLRQGIGQGDSGIYLRKSVASTDDSSDGPIERNSRLTLCMIAGNEEERLGRCLQSARDVVDEIVVVDTGSTDRTIEIAEEYGAVIGHFAWCDDWAAARNASLELATGDWIMWLDPDDILPAECHVAIRRLVAGARDKAYFFVLDDQGYEHVSCLQMRLFPNVEGVRFEMPVHEQVTPSLGRLGLEMLATEIRVEHTGYSTPEIVRAKKERYLKIIERWLDEHPEDYMQRSHVALTYYSTDRLDEALAAYRYIIEKSRCYADCNWVVYATSLLFLGRTYMKMEQFEQARDYMLKAEQVDDRYILTKLSLAEVSAHLEEYDQVLSYARAVTLDERQMTFFPIDYEEVSYSAFLLCGQAHQALEEWDEAAVAFRRAAQVPVPRRSEALGNLSNLYKAQGQRDQAQQALQEAVQIDPHNAEHLFNAGVLWLEKKELEQAESYFTEALKHRPDFSLALLNLGYIAKVQGKLEEAEAIYRRALGCDSEGVEARANLGHLYIDQERFAEAEKLFVEVRARKKGLLDIDLGYLLALVQDPVLNWSACAALLLELKGYLSDWVASDEDLTTVETATRRLGELGALLLRNNLHKCAELALAAAVALDETWVDGHRLLAEVLFAQGGYWKAVAQLEAVLQVDPQDGESFRRLGDCYSKLGVAEAAKMCYARSEGAGSG